MFIFDPRQPSSYFARPASPIRKSLRVSTWNHPKMQLCSIFWMNCDFPMHCWIHWGSARRSTSTIKNQTAIVSSICSLSHKIRLGKRLFWSSTQKFRFFFFSFVGQAVGNGKLIHGQVICLTNLQFKNREEDLRRIKRGGRHKSDLNRSLNDVVTSLKGWHLVQHNLRRESSRRTLKQLLREDTQSCHRLSSCSTSDSILTCYSIEREVIKRKSKEPAPIYLAKTSRHKSSWRYFIPSPTESHFRDHENISNGILERETKKMRWGEAT
jgi:hypothetical protein